MLDHWRLGAWNTPDSARAPRDPSEAPARQPAALFEGKGARVNGFERLGGCLLVAHPPELIDTRYIRLLSPASGRDWSNLVPITSLFSATGKIGSFWVPGTLTPPRAKPPCASEVNEGVARHQWYLQPRRLLRSEGRE